MFEVNDALDTIVTKDDSVKHHLKLIRWKWRRWLAAQRWGRNALESSPVVFGNAMPKSGSHLIIQILQGLTRFGPFVNPGFPPVNRAEDNRALSPKAVLEVIHAMQPGDIGYGYIKAERQFIEALTGEGRATIFVFRDPRDMVVSHVFYATEMFKGHGMHRYYTEKLSSMEERINAAIIGVNEDEVTMKGVRARYEAYLGWLEQPTVLCLKFEDLILNQESAFRDMLNYLKGRGFSPEIQLDQQISFLKSAITPHRSGTFRRGKPGNWREYFTQSNIDLFKEHAGELLICLGYEVDKNW